MEDVRDEDEPRKKSGDVDGKGACPHEQVVARFAIFHPLSWREAVVPDAWWKEASLQGRCRKTKPAGGSIHGTLPRTLVPLVAPGVFVRSTSNFASGACRRLVRRLCAATPSATLPGTPHPWDSCLVSVDPKGGHLIRVSNAPLSWTVDPRHDRVRFRNADATDANEAVRRRVSITTTRTNRSRYQDEKERIA